MLDTVTLLVAVSVVCTVFALAFARAWRRRRSDGSLLTWVASYLLLAAAPPLFALRGHIPDFASIAAANAIVLLSYNLRWVAARQFARRRTSAGPVVLPVALWLTFCLYPPFYESFVARTLLALTLVVAMTLHTAWEFWRDRSDGLPSRTAIALLYVVIAIAYFVLLVVHVRIGTVPATGISSWPWYNMQLLLVIAASVANAVLILSLPLEREERDQRRIAARDPLTGVYNRRALDTLGSAEIGRSLRSGRPVSAIIFDIDRFKAINDRFGHFVGDQVLQHFADLCQQFTRSGDILARLGGEEFVILLPETSGPDAQCIAERIRLAFSDIEHRLDGQAITCTVSAGVYSSMGAETTVEHLLVTADACLYEAKHAGRNRVVVQAA